MVRFPVARGRTVVIASERFCLVACRMICRRWAARAAVCACCRNHGAPPRTEWTLEVSGVTGSTYEVGTWNASRNRQVIAESVKGASGRETPHSDSRRGGTESYSRKENRASLWRKSEIDRNYPRARGQGQPRLAPIHSACAHAELAVVKEGGSCKSPVQLLP